ncbi:ATP-binding protein [Paraburkholderia sp. Tr-20389]|uniref:ATP-binding protein n=1 Tax=Paraburkholderia sp. Tr-20389 TaxID=2703903 RepID=UPI00197E8057|nr:ATP-binding protein [Paraburkholderia sp. Tr-20389]MBN3755338.1 ATP-binding protein [Paraburkholderia sp. Tr-20389]
MAKVHVTAKRDFIQSLVSAKPILALSELIWNGFDAGASRVRIIPEYNEMGGLDCIRVRDDGYGINHNRITSLFGGLGDSWKKQQGKQFGRALHGKNGKGRFKAFSLGERIEWNTIYSEGEGRRTYHIVGHASAIDDFDVSDPIDLDVSQSTGTEVVIENVTHDFRSFKDGSALVELAKIFAAYLTEYPELRLEFDGNVVNPADVQQDKVDYRLRDVQLSDGRRVQVSLTIVEWRMSTERVLHLCDANGVTLHELPVGQQVRAPGFNFTVYVKADLFRELDKTGELVLSDIHPDVQVIMRAARSKTKDHFRRRLAENQSEVVAKWKEEQIYPYDEKADIGPVEAAERQVFDILAVNVQSYLPSFEEADAKSKKFTFKLLAQAIRQNPDSVQVIISEVLGLKEEAQNELAALLKKTSLSSIISSAKIVANRLDFLNGLETLIFDKESKEALLERDQLHKMLENESWLFHEEYALAGSEQRLEEVLQKHIAKLGHREEELNLDAPVDLGNGKRGRIDLMLHKAIQPRTGEYEYLVVELKRPSKKIDDEVITQVKKYAIAVSNDERFRDVPAKWTFVAVSNDLDAFAKKEANQRDRPKGQVYDDADQNITVWVRSWADVINDARAKLRFINQQLSYEADAESAKDYLRLTHAKFIPDVLEVSDDEPEAGAEAFECDSEI